jgi:hypothetical protein
MDKKLEFYREAKLNRYLKTLKGAFFDCPHSKVLEENISIGGWKFEKGIILCKKGLDQECFATQGDERAAYACHMQLRQRGNYLQGKCLKGDDEFNLRVY